MDNWIIVRTQNAGVFCGIRESIDDVTRKVVLKEARRLWYWDGAASLSELSQKGVSKPQNCKFPAEVPIVTLYEVIEILQVSEKAVQSIQSVPVWSAHND
jgi:hypothetical protein